MTKLARSKTIRFLVFGVLVLAATSCAQKRSSVPEQTARTNAEQIAKTYGLDSFGQIEAIRYTWNAQFPGVNVSRSWVWEPKTGQVSYEGKDKDGKPVKASYLLSQLNSQPANVKDDIDPAFKNDNYWTDHHGTADGNPLRIFISDVSVKLTGSENWISAQ
jgi:hypothetical protein